jgi:hypothetical protein
MTMRGHKLLSCGALFLALTTAACGYYRITPKAIEPGQLTAQSPTEISTPAKAHLKDGGVVLFPDGFRVDGGLIKGKGEKYDLTRQSRLLVSQLPLNEVAALEHYEKDLRPVASTISTGGTIATVAIGVVAAAGLFKVLFGSCPTIYSLEDGRQLEAELFSHSISRRFEGDDVDRLSGVSLRDGGYRLQLANEALETHYINRIALGVIDHPAGTNAYPSPEGEVVVFRGDAPFTAQSRRGEEVTAALAARDDVAYRTDPVLTRELARDITEDWVELAVPVPAEAQTKNPVVALRLRNTLMATVLLYDVMLRAQGVNALEWLGSDTLNPFYAWRVFRWFDRHYSLRVQVWDGDRFVTAASLSPTGPIAWHDVAVKLPPVRGPEARIRVSFLPDNWMVDWASVGFGTAEPLAMSSIPAAGLDGLSGERAEEILSPLREKDHSYLITSPGESYTLFFPAEAPATGTERTCFLRSRGFYIEWLRDDWFNDTGRVTAAPPFEPGDEAVIQTARLWLQKKDDMERRFTETKIPLAGGAP